jgi:hypothetical protein
MRYLPFNDPNVDWAWFEEAVRDLFRRMDGYTNVNLYGVAGDHQDGIDMTANTEERGHVGIQCKKVQNFGAANVTAAVRAATYAADGFILALSIKAAVGARTELAKHAGWDLWDQVRLSDAVRDLPLEAAIDYVERHFGEGTSAAFLGRHRPSTFLSRDAFFEPFTDPNRPINHAWTRVGTSAPLDKLAAFLASDERVAVVQGPIGIGKSKLLFDLTAEPIVDRSVAFHATGVEITTEGLRELRPGPGLVIVDDAASVGGLGALLAHALRTPGLKVILTGPASNRALQESVLDAGFAPAELCAIALHRLTRVPTIALVQQVIGRQDPHIEETVVNNAISSPLDTILTARVLADLQRRRGDLTNPEAVRDLVRALYREVTTGHVSDEIPKDDVKAALQLLAALGPAKIEDAGWLDAASAVVAMDLDRLLRTLDAIEDAGILVRRGFHYFIAPEMLRQSLLLEALVVRGRPTTLPSRILEHFPNDPQFLRNVAIVDLESQSNDGPDVFTPVWRPVRDVVVQANSLDRAHFVEHLKELGYYKPYDVFELVTYLIDHPATNEETQPFFGAGYDFDHDDVVRQVAGALRYVMLGSLDLVALCVALLWRLGKDRENFGRGDDPLQMLTELARYEVGSGTSLATKIVEAVAALITAGERDTAHRSLLDVIAPVLARDIMSTLSRGKQLTMQRRVLVVDSVRPLRDAATAVVTESAKGPDDRRADRAIELLVDLLRDPEHQVSEPTTEAVSSWDRERSLSFDALDEVVAAGTWPLRELRIANLLPFYATYGRSELVRTRATALLQQLASTTNRDRFRLLIDRFLTFDTFMDVRTEEPAVGEERRANFVEKTTSSLLADHADATALLDDLAARLDAIERAGLSGSPWLAFWAIVRLRAERSDALGNAILERRDPRFLRAIAPFVSTRLERDAAEGEAFALRVLAEGSIEAAIGVANALSLREAAGDRDGHVRQELFARLLTDPRIAVRRAAAHNLLFFKARYPDRIIALVIVAQLDDDANLSDRVFMALPRGIENMGADTLQKLTAKLERTPELEYWPLAFLTNIAAKHSPIVMHLLGARVVDERREHDFRAVPYVGRAFDELVAALITSPTFPHELAALAERAACVPRARDRFAVFVGRVANAAPGMVKELVATALHSNDAEQQRFGASLLRHLPHELVMEDVPYVVELLESAYAVSDELGVRVGGPITNALISGASAVGHYEAAPGDLRLTAFGEAALQQPGLSPVVRRFLENLTKTGRNSAEHTIRSSEEAFGPE